MSHRTEIDKELAKLESLVTGEDHELEEAPEESPNASKGPNWLLIVGIAVGVDLAARFFVPSDSFVRILEALIFAAAGVALILPVVRKTALSGLRRKIHSWLAAALGLGAIRSGMWGMGIPVQYANLTIFLIAVVGLATFFLVRGRAGKNGMKAQNH